MGFFDTTLTSIFRNPFSADGRPRRSEADLQLLVESTVDKVDPRIRLIGGYKKRLMAVVEQALDYVESMVEMIPDPVVVNRSSFGTDPRVNAFFVSADDLQSVLSRSSELQDYLLEQQGRDLTECCALLCMRKTERRVLGMDLNGDQVRRDVQQVTVSFSEHQVISPGATEDEVREGLKCCMFQALVSQVLDGVSGCKASVEHLTAQRRSLHARLRSLESGQRKSTGDFNPDTHPEALELQQRLSESQEQIERTQCRGPEDSLERLVKALTNPAELINLHHTSLRLSRLGVKLESEGESGGSSNAVNFAEVDLGEADRRVVVLAKFAPRELFVNPAMQPDAEQHISV